MRGTFLDIFKAFDKVWDQFIIFKLHQNEISGKLSKPKKLLVLIQTHCRRPILNFCSFDSTKLANEHTADFIKIKNWLYE